MGAISPRRPFGGWSRPLVAAAAGGLFLAFGLWATRSGSPREATPEAAARPAPIPKIDVHVHVAPTLAGRAVELLARQGIGIALNASGGAPEAGLELSVAARERTGGALRPYCNLALSRVRTPDFAAYVESTLAACKAQGAVGLKVPKSLGLGILSEARELLRIDDPRLDVVFERAGSLGLPVLIHSGDPRAFFEPPGAANERHEELAAHPDWSFHGTHPSGVVWPSWDEVLDQFERRVLRHPSTTFVGAHFGNAPEDPARVARLLDRAPRYVIETAARVPEIGRRDPGEMRRFFTRYADRILFGSDLQLGPHGVTLGSAGAEPDRLDRLPFFFEAQFRYFERTDRDLESPTPVQGRWPLRGLGLPRDVLERLYWRNAARVFGLPEPRAPAMTAG